jgi:pilus assembly protein CpaF
MESDVITLQDLFTFDFKAGIDERGRFRGVLRSTGLRPRFVDTLEDAGVHLSREIFANVDPVGRA